VDIVEISVHIPKNVYDALDAALEANKTPHPDPANPKRTIYEPVFDSVEAWVEKVVDDNISPFMQQRRPSPEVAALEAQMRELQDQMKRAQKTVVGVKRVEPTPVES
jgi:molecular chaperone GrpE (heat shock protein)